jgi:retron-type reverse transcriptase
VIKFKKFKKKPKRELKREPFRYKDVSIQDLRAHVTRQQQEIAMVLRNKDIKDAQKRMRALVRSEPARALAVYEVISKKGYRSKGFSPNVPKTNGDYMMMVQDLWKIVKSPPSYQATPLARTLIPKPKGGLRPISVPTYLDRALQHLYKLVLDIACEELSEPNSFGFRAFRSPGMASKAVTLALWTRKEFGPPKFVIEADVAKSFDTIDHDFILANVASTNSFGPSLEIIPRTIMNQWLKCGFILVDDQSKTITETTGVPQGGPISPTVCNMVFNGLEKHIREGVANMTTPVKNKATATFSYPYWMFSYQDANGPKKAQAQPKFCTTADARSPDVYSAMEAIIPGTIARTKKILNHITNGKNRLGWTAQKIGDTSSYQKKRDLANQSWSYLARFADDFIVCCNSEAAVKKVFELSEEFLSQRGMKLNKEKSIVKKFLEPFSFVGFEFRIRQNHGKHKVMVIPPPLKVKKLLEKINGILDPYRSAEKAFLKINSIIRGWCNFYAVGNSKKAFSSINYKLWHAVYRFFYRKYSKLPQWKKSNKHVMARKLSTHIWQRHLRPYKTFTTWWTILAEDRAEQGSRYKGLPLYLESTYSFKVKTPSIVQKGNNLAGGLNAFHPEDREILSKKALRWKVGLSGKILKKQQGLCASCKCNLVEGSLPYEVHHIKPIKFGGNNKFTNLLIMCTACHRDATTAVSSQNKDLILDFEGRGLLVGVSSEISK